MSNTPKIPAQELFFNLANLMNGKTSASVIFAGHAFNRKFKVYEVERGKYRFLEQLSNQVLVYTTERAIEIALLSYLTKLPEKDFSPYKFTASRAAQAVQFWMAQSESYFDAVKNKIQPVLELSQEGYCWQRTDFDAAEGPAPLWESILSHVETNPVLLEAFLGGIFDPNFTRQFYLWMQGPGGDGKGSIMRLMHKIYGSAYMAMSSDLKNQNQFFTASLVGKRIAAFQDCHNARLPISEIFMQLAGGDPMRIEEKGMPAYMASLDAIPVITSNYEPAITGSEAHMRRLILVKFKQRTKFDGAKDTYEDRLWGERAAIIFRCKAAWAKLKATHSGFPDQREIKEDLAYDGDIRWHTIVARYFAEIEGLGLGESVHSSDVYSLLCEREKLTDFQYSEFKRYLARHGHNILRLSTGNRPRVFAGLKLKEQGEKRF